MKIRKRLLRGIAGLFTGICVFSLSKSMVMASGIRTLANMNQGAAQLLDNVEFNIADAAVVPDKTEDKADSEEEPPSGLVMANVKNSLNIREEPSTDAAKVGLLYADCGGEVLDTTEGWTKIKSGNVVGWASNEYLFFGEEAEEVAKSVGHTIATVTADALRVRKKPTEDSGIYGLIKKGDEIEINPEFDNDEWLSIEYDGDEGFINAGWVIMELEVGEGETLAEIKEREAREKAAKEKAERNKNLGAVVVDASDDVLLAALIQCEAGGQPYEGKVGVAAVVMNRVRSGAYPSTVSGVIYAAGQFPPALNGKVAARVQAGVSDECLKAARAAIAGETTVGSATHFRRAGYHDGYVIGNHVFW